jgi:alkanesulfonate monooxygenase SsuD/methylene tetrahydromethanopterin reductase-like flavin-dependent oxidoreductase (luciferase family)
VAGVDAQSEREGTLVQDVTIGLQLPQEFISIGTLRSVWMLADEGGFDSCWLFDHLAPRSPRRTGEVFEAWTLLAAIAVTTTRIRMGVLVTDVTRRHPVLLAKMAVTVDHLSAGRLDVGLGAGGDAPVDRMLNVPTRPPRERVARLAEVCHAMDVLWTERTGKLTGLHQRLEQTMARPKPVQQPRPPVWVGSRGEQFGLRAVAEYADVWVPAVNPGEPLSELIRLSRVLDRHCTDVGRDPATVRRAIQFFPPADPGEAQRMAEKYVTAGFRDLVLMVSYASQEAAYSAAETAAALLPRLRELQSSNRA